MLITVFLKDVAIYYVIVCVDVGSIYCASVLSLLYESFCVCIDDCFRCRHCVNCHTAVLNTELLSINFELPGLKLD